MPTASGFTTFGIVRKRMADLYSDFALRIKENGVFGTQTTADAPDVFAADPLVQIMATTSASLHEVWEAVELWYGQLNLETATGTFLDQLHGSRLGVLRAVGQTDESYRATLLAATARPSRTAIETVAVGREDVECAKLVLSTPQAPVEGIPAPGAALVIKGCAVDYNALACSIADSVELGMYSLVGNRFGSCTLDNGSCLTYTFMEAVPVYAAMEVKGFYSDGCSRASTDTLREQIAAALTAATQCQIGSVVSGGSAMRVLSVIEGFVVTEVRFARRARELWGNGCDPADAPKVMLCGIETPWVTSQTCGIGAGEVWCEPTEACLGLDPWEYIAFDQQFITVTVGEEGC